MAYRVLIFLLLMSTWVIFSGQFDAMHLTLGVLSSAFVTAISADLLFARRSTGIATRIAEGIKLSIYLGWLLWQVVLANMHLLRLSLLPGGMKDVEPAIVKYRTALKSDFARYLLANSITLTPGTITTGVEGQDYEIHALSAADLETDEESRMDLKCSWVENG